MNKAILMGRLVADPELRHTPNNVAVTSFRLAVNRRFQRDTADFIDIVAWRQTAEFVSNYFRKGMQVAVVGSIQTRTWKDKDGNNRYATEVVADEAYFADSKREAAARGGDAFEGMTPPPAAPSGGRTQQNAAPAFEIPVDSDFSKLDDDDDLPF
ncbi:MAG: single-stranded DNA-binding protein [Eubacteriales bacterium]|jgi:single-strand DNA-binding protein